MAVPGRRLRGTDDVLPEVIESVDQAVEEIGGTELGTSQQALGSTRESAICYMWAS
jgi:hypothetical protein